MVFLPVFGTELAIGMLFSATYDAIKKGTEFIEPGYTGLIVETVEELSSSNTNFNMEIISEFFLNESVSEQIKKYRKTAEVDYSSLEEHFVSICLKYEISNPRELLREFFKLLEKKLYKKPDLQKKIQLKYLQNIYESVKEIKKQTNKIPQLEGTIKSLVDRLEKSPYPLIIIPEKGIKTKPEISELTNELNEEEKNKLIESTQIISSTQFTLQLSVHFFKEKDFEISSKLVEYVLKQEPDNLNAKQNKATILLAQNKIKESLVLVEEILKIDPNQVATLITKGVILRRKRKYKDAIACHEKAINLDPDESTAYNGKGVCLAVQGKYDDAIELYDIAISKEPTLPEPWSNKGLSLFFKGNFKEAEECYKKALDIDQANPGTLNNLALLEQYRGNIEKAISLHDEALSIDENFAPSWRNKGVILFDKNQIDEAIKHYQKALDIDPNYVEALDSMSLAQSKYDLTKSLELNELALKIEPNNLEILEHRMLILFYLGRFEDLLKTCKQVFDLDKDNINALVYQGSALLETTDRYADVISICDKVLEKDKKNALALLNKGISLRRLGKTDKALSIIVEAEKMNPNNDAIITTKGSILFDQGQYDEARTCFENAIKIRPSNPQPYYNIACLSMLENRIDEVITNLKKAVEIAPWIRNQILRSTSFNSIQNNPDFLRLFID